MCQNKTIYYDNKTRSKESLFRAKISITLRNDWIKCKQVNFKLFLVLTFKQTYTFTLKIELKTI